MARVIISSGHTTANPGVIANGLNEYELARKIAKYALKYIRLNGIISLSTPPNLELQQRIEWINKTGYTKAANDIAIEVHINDGNKRGIEGWFEGEGSSPSLELAAKLVEAICKETQLPSQGVKSEFSHELGSIAFVHEVASHACIIECGYIDNKEDSDFLKIESNIEKIGKGLAIGVLNYFQLEYKEFPVQAPVNNQQFQAQSPISQTVISQTPVSQVQIQQPQQIQQTQQTQVYDKTLETQTDNYDKEDFDPDIDEDDEDDFYDLEDYSKTQNNTSSVNVTSNNIKPVVNTQPVNYQNTNVANNNVSNNQGYIPLPSREDRKEMIIKNYKKILGREPNNNDLNYFLNIGIREDELIKKMIESQEHLDLVKAKQELISTKEKLEKTERELIGLKSETDEQKNIIENLHDSIDQKNIALSKFNNDIRDLQRKLNDKPLIEDKKEKREYQGNFIDRLFKKISDMLE